MIVDDWEDGARMFHSLCERFDRHVFPLSFTKVCRGIMTWREIDRLVR